MNGWRRVPRADVVPQSCAVFPQLGSAHHEGYVDTGMELATMDPHIYISVHAARQLGEFVGLKDPEVLERRIAELEVRNVVLSERVAEADRFREAAEYTLGRFGAKVQKKPGRPKAAA